MVVIRLSRGGAKKRPFYNIVATDRRNRRDGRFLERIGYYNPMASGNDQPMVVALDRIEYWTSRGAQVSDAVAKLISHHGNSDKAAKPSGKKTRAMKKADAAKAEAAAAAAEAATEAADSGAEAADDAGGDAKGAE